MTQIVERHKPNAVNIGALADGATLSMDTIMRTLTHKAFLFEYEAQGTISCEATPQFFDEGGVAIVLVEQGSTDSEIEFILAGSQITDQNMNVQIPLRQQMFALAEVEFNAFNVDTANAGNFHWKVHFKPKAKGGIPFTEGSGWETRFINRTGALLTTGSIINTGSVNQRFAYEGGGGA